MADTVIDTLQVKITANAKEATRSLSSLSNALKNVRTQLTGVNKNGLTVADRLSKSLNEMNGALNTITTGGIKKLQKLANALNEYASAVKNIKGAGSIASNIKSVQGALSNEGRRKGAGWKSDVTESEYTEEDFKILNEDAVSVGAAVDTVAKKFSLLRGYKNVFADIKKGFKGVIKSFKDFRKEFKFSDTAIGRFFNSLKRIAFYRAIRSALKAISEAFSEGLKNAYAYSKQTEGFERLANTLDRIKSITSQMTNQLGALLGEVKQFLLPAIEWIVEKVRYAAERVTEFVAALNGEKTYLFARYVEEAWDDATDAVKKYKHQLLGLDELNNLTKDTDGKLAGTDAKDKFYKKAVNENLFDLANKIKKFTLGIGDVLFDWGKLTGSDIESKIVTGLLGAAGGLLAGVPGAIIGTLAGVGIKLLIDELKPAEYGHVYDEPTLFDILYPALLGITGGIIGFELGKGKGALIGMTVGAALGMTLNELFEFGKGITYGEEDLFNLLKPGLFGIMGGLVGVAYGGAKGAIVGLTIGTTIGFMFNKFDPAEYALTYKHENLFALLEPALMGLTGGLIGYKFGSKTGHGISGLFMGLAIGTSVGFILQAFEEAKAKGITKEFVLDRICDGIMGVMGAVAGFAVTGGSTTGAAIGMTIGISLSMIIKDIDLFGTQAAFEKAARAQGFDVSDGNLVFTGNKTTTNNTQKSAFDRAAEAQGITFEKKALGGVVNGSLFWAGESGAEFVGNIGSTSAVANTGQMTDAIYKAAYMGMSKALKENGGGGMGGFEPATMDDLFIAMRKKSNEYNMTKGSPAFG